MGSRIKSNRIILDGEVHECGGLCWCFPQYSASEDTFLHFLEIDKYRTIPGVYEV